MTFSIARQARFSTGGSFLRGDRGLTVIQFSNCDCRTDSTAERIFTAERISTCLEAFWGCTVVFSCNLSPLTSLFASIDGTHWPPTKVTSGTASWRWTGVGNAVRGSEDELRPAFKTDLILLSVALSGWMVGRTQSTERVCHWNCPQAVIRSFYRLIRWLKYAPSETCTGSNPIHLIIPVFRARSVVKVQPVRVSGTSSDPNSTWSSKIHRQRPKNNSYSNQNNLGTIYITSISMVRGWQQSERSFGEEAKKRSLKYRDNPSR